MRAREAASSARACRLEIAVATNSVKSASRRSMPAASARSRETVVIAPQSSPATTIGLASAERTRSARTAPGMPGAAGSSVSNRAARPVRWTSATTESGSSLTRAPTACWAAWSP